LDGRVVRLPKKQNYSSKEPEKIEDDADDADTLVDMTL
jgi:hypothetical protein